MVWQLDWAPCVERMGAIGALMRCIRSATTTSSPPHKMATCDNVILCLEHLSVQPALSSWHPTARLYIVSPISKWTNATNIKLRCQSHPASMLEKFSFSVDAFLAASWPWQHGKKSWGAYAPASPNVQSTSKFGKNTPHWCISFNANPTVSITHAWRLGVVLCEGRGHSWKLTITKHLCTTKFPILKMWGWKSGPHYTLGNPTVAKNQKVWVLVLAASARLWKNGNPLQ